MNFDTGKPIGMISLGRLRALLGLFVLSTLVTATAFAQSDRGEIDGVKNFGRVTDLYFRGGAITSTGIENLANLGVRTIIDLRDNPNSKEPKHCEAHGIKYYNFPMTGHDTPDDRVVAQILSLIQTAAAPVYVHCSAGKHRAGTIAALYRTRIQGWSKAQAWEEQQSYGFGSVSSHPRLYAYVYGDELKASKKSRRSEGDSVASDEDAHRKSSKSKKKSDDDDDDDDKKEHKRKKKDADR